MCACVHVCVLECHCSALQGAELPTANSMVPPPHLHLQVTTTFLFFAGFLIRWEDIPKWWQWCAIPPLPAAPFCMLLVLTSL